MREYKKANDPAAQAEDCVHTTTAYLVNSKGRATLHCYSGITLVLKNERLGRAFYDIIFSCTETGETRKWGNIQIQYKPREDN